jgi:uncharacterized membrane protein required for colicin V production
MILDLIIAAIILLGALNGWRRGAVAIIGSIIILFAAILIASAFANPFGKALGIGPTLLHSVTGFFILFLILIIIGSFLKRFLTPKSGIFAGANKILGLVFGILRAVLLLGLLFGFLRIFQIPSAKQANDSKTYPIILKSSAIMVTQLKPLASQLSSDIYEDLTPADSAKHR